MPRPGDNLPGYRAIQLSFAAHIRNPDSHPAPDGVEARRMRIYAELFYNNVEGFLAGAFPVAKRILDPAGLWHPLAREFLHRHGSGSPYFLEISQEFLNFLAERGLGGLPPFLLELCHYEWVELALSVADVDLDDADVDPEGDLRSGIPVVSPLAWKLGYRYPVHRIGPDHQPDGPGARPTELIVYRRRDDTVRFMEVTGLTLALVDALDGERTGDEALASVIETSGLPGKNAYDQGLETMERMRKADVVLGTRRSARASKGDLV